VLDSSGKAFDSSSKLNTDYDFFEMLRASGKHALQRFLDAHYDDIGVRSTADIDTGLSPERV
jgi:NTE family protein